MKSTMSPDLMGLVLELSQAVRNYNEWTLILQGMCHDPNLGLTKLLTLLHLQKGRLEIHDPWVPYQPCDSVKGKLRHCFSKELRDWTRKVSSKVLVCVWHHRKYCVFMYEYTQSPAHGSGWQILTNLKIKRRKGLSSASSNFHLLSPS